MPLTLLCPEYSLTFYTEYLISKAKLICAEIIILIRNMTQIFSIPQEIIYSSLLLPPFESSG